MAERTAGKGAGKPTKGGNIDTSGTERRLVKPGHDPVIRIAKTHKALARLLDSILSGRIDKPEWIYLRGECRLDDLESKELSRVLTKLHSCVLRGFRARNVKIKSRKARSQYWRTVAQHGFHDYSDFGWMKCYDSPFVENYDYITAYKEGGLAKLDAYQLYSAVLGTHDFTVEDFVNTKLCRDVDTIIEPMAGTAEFAYQGHFRYPEFRYLMFDLDEDAKRHVDAMPWLEQADRHYVIANALEESIWQRAKSMTATKSLSYIGKQSHHFFDAKQLVRILDIGTRHIDYFMLETPQMSLVTDMAEEDDLTRPEMQDAGFEVALIENEDGAPNAFTNMLSFRLEAWDKHYRRTLFNYGDWTNWSQPTLVALAHLLDLEVLFYHSEEEEFVNVNDREQVDECDCLDNVTFMMFTRHKGA
jgi:hypothetical protein